MALKEKDAKEDNGLADFLDDTTIMEDDFDDNEDDQEDSISDEVDDLDDEDDDTTDNADDDISDGGTLDESQSDDDETEGETEEDQTQSGQGAQEQIRILTELVSKLTQQQLKDTPTEKKVEKADPFKSESFKNLQTILDLDDTEMAVMAGFLQEMNESTQTTAVERALQLTPDVVTKHMDTKTIITTAKEKFYAANPKLQPVQEYVRITANAIAQRNPNYSIKQVLDEAAETTYKTLNIDKTPSNDAAKPGKRKPAFAKGTTGSRKKVEKKRSKADDVEDLFN